MDAVVGAVHVLVRGIEVPSIIYSMNILSTNFVLNTVPEGRDGYQLSPFEDVYFLIY